jgi:hypothetical protein
MDEAAAQAFYGRNPKTGKAYTQAESAAFNGGYNYGAEQGGPIGYEVDPRTGNLNILFKNGMVATTGAKYDVSSAGYIVPQKSSLPPGVGFDEYGKAYQPGEVMPNETLAAYVQRMSQLGPGQLSYKGKTYLYNSRGMFYENGTQEPANFLDTAENSASTPYALRTAQNVATNLNSFAPGTRVSGNGSPSNPLLVNGATFTGTQNGITYNNGIISNNTSNTTVTDYAAQARLDARVEFANTLKALGLPQDLIDEVDTMIKNDYTKSQMYLELKKTQAYNNRFPGMKSLSAAGKAVDEGTYISMEKGFLQTLDFYGIDKKIFGTTAELGNQIGKLVSPKAFEDRVALAAQDVEANPDVLAQLNLYFGVDKSAAITYLLNPEIGLDIIKRQARAAEIGAKAASSKFDFGQTKEGYGVAESFINAAGTMDLQALDVAFQQARGLANTQSSIAATEGASYNDLQAVSAILGKDQAAILDSQRRAARSVARFSGGSGLGLGSLKQETTI